MGTCGCESVENVGTNGVRRLLPVLPGPATTNKATLEGRRTRELPAGVNPVRSQSRPRQATLSPETFAINSDGEEEHKSPDSRAVPWRAIRRPQAQTRPYARVVMPSGVTEEVKKVIHSHGHVSIASLAILISSMCSPLVAVTSEQKLPWSLLEATMPSTGEQFSLYYVHKGYHDLGTSDHGGHICSLPRTSFEFITQQIFALCGDPPSTLTTTMSGRSSKTAFTVVNLIRALDSTWKHGEHLQQAVESQRPIILVGGPSSQMADTMCPTAIRRQDLPVVVCRPRPTAGQHPASEPLLLAHWPTPAAQQHRVCRDKRQDVSHSNIDNENPELESLVDEDEAQEELRRQLRHVTAQHPRSLRRLMIVDERLHILDHRQPDQLTR